MTLRHVSEFYHQLNNSSYRVISKPRDVPFISSVKEDGSTFVPVFGGDQITLEEGLICSEIEVVQLQNGLKEKVSESQSLTSSPHTMLPSVGLLVCMP